jgi:hypothetical protein
MLPTGSESPGAARKSIIGGILNVNVTVTAGCFAGLGWDMAEVHSVNPQNLFQAPYLPLCKSPLKKARLLRALPLALSITLLLQTAMA